MSFPSYRGSSSDDDCRPSRPNSSSSITSSSDWKECDDDDDYGGGISPSRLQRTPARITTNLSISSPTYTGTHPSGTEADDDAEIFTARRRTAAAFEITARNELVRPLTRLGGGSVGAEWTVIWWFDGACEAADYRAFRERERKDGCREGERDVWVGVFSVYVRERQREM
ncbi:hypothetical protein ACFE04_003624 [Oxalis oulophora]